MDDNTVSLLLRLAVCAALSIPAGSRAQVAQTGRANVDHLKREYLECDRTASTTVQARDDVMRCSVVAQALLVSGFDSDLNRLIAWWQREKDRTPQAVSPP